MATKGASKVAWPGAERKRSGLRETVRSRAAGRVLVVDDEAMIRQFVVRALSLSGYEVIEATSAEQAMMMLEAEAHSLSLLLSDVGLPGASGADLAKYAQQRFPHLPTQLMSASSKAWLVSERVLREDVDLLQKPFTVAELLERVGQWTR